MPAGHDEHDTAPAELKSPWPHEVHPKGVAAPPGSDEYLPAAQPVQEALADRVLNAPAVHDVHTLEVDAPTGLPYAPALQAVHEPDVVLVADADQ